MRFYQLVLSDPQSGLVWKPTADGLGFTKSAGGFTFSSFVNGKTDMGALNVEFDFPIYAWHQSQGKQWIRIWGVGLSMIGQAANLNGANFSLSAGMKPGLPLATAAANQAGLILQGVVFQAFGNWEGVNQTLELVVNPGAGDVANIYWNWPKNTPLSAAIATTLAQAFPQYPNPTINIGSNLLLPYTETGHYPDLPSFADYLNRISIKAGTAAYGKDYAGVQVVVLGNSIQVTDDKGVQPAKVIALAFQDLIGQPTWIAPNQVSFKTVLRADIGISMQVKFPLGIGSPYALTSAGAATPGAPVSSKTAFQGSFVINDVHHFAAFRQADAESWNTTYTASVVSP
jgi:hypothetical protein